MLASAPVPDAISLRWRGEFRTFEHAIYLNSCSLGALSRQSRAKVNEHLDLWELHGASAWYEIWWAALADLRAAYARQLGAPAGTIALHPNITSALATVASAIDTRRRPKVVVTSLEFPTVPYQWLTRRDIEVVIVESPDGISVPVEQVAAAIDDRTALVATTHVAFTSGAILDVRGIADAAHRHGALCLVDGYHGAGQLPVDVAALDCDFYASGGLKWLLGGTGIAFLYARESLLPTLAPEGAGWFSHRNQFAFDPRHHAFHDDARRLEGGTPAVASVYAQLGGLEVLEAVGQPAIRRVTMALTEDLIEQARALGLSPKVAPTPETRTGIVMLPSEDPHATVRRLREAGYVVDARPGHVRVSPYFYNLPDDHRGMLEVLTR